jgi:HAE1 family hydrophobic/amphiphilic exporter-1
MGVIAIGGLATSTMLTLLVVPVVYTLVDEAGGFLLRLARRLRPGGATGTGPARPESAPSRRAARAKGR